MSNNVTSTVRPGQQLLISSTVYGEVDRDVEYLAVVEVRDSEGVTAHLSWQGNKLEPFGSNKIEFSWIPGNNGIYYIRSFAVTDLSDPQVLSQVHESRLLTVR